ncbi:MAG: LCP family protein, partial [Sporomusaceae bacterium]|nr:LCP family protein [Sporomusaceae bacterium]
GDIDVPGSPSRSDAMLLASVDLTQKNVHVISIPRDTRVNIPGHKGLEKINNAYFYGGSTLALKTLEDFLHISIPYYMTAKWQGFIEVVDILGGVDLYVEHDMDYEDPYANLAIHLHKGYQHLNGEQAGEYVRFRHDELGDIGRVERQQKFLKALSEQFWRAETIVKIPYLVSAVHRNLEMNMSIATSLQAANVLRGLKSGQFVAEMLPGNFATIDNISYWEPDKTQIKLLIERAFAAQALPVAP